MLQENIAVGCFFMIAVAYKLAWTAISSLLSQFSAQYGPDILLKLNVAYFLPSIPVLILQTVVNDRMDRRLGLSTAAMLRFSIGLGGLVGLTMYFPLLAGWGEVWLLAATAAIGMSYGVAFGTSYQLASKFSPGCTVALTTGFVSSGPVVLVLDLLLKKSAFYSADELGRMFQAVASITLVGLAAAYLMLLVSRRHLAMLSQQLGGSVHVRLGQKLPLSSSKSTYSAKEKIDGDHKYLVSRKTVTSSEGFSHGGSYINGSSHSVLMDAMEGGGHSSFTAGGGDLGRRGSNSGGGMSHDDVDNDKFKRSMRPLLLAWRILPAMFAIFLSVGTSMIVFPFFTYMQSSGLLRDRLAQVLFYVRLIGDIAGRLVPQRLQATRISSLMFWVFIKACMVPAIFMSIFHPEAMLGDIGAVSLVAIFWVLSGYVNTCAYLMAPKLVPVSQKPRASGLMTVAFQSSCFLALLVAAAIQHSSMMVPTDVWPSPAAVAQPPHADNPSGGYFHDATAYASTQHDTGAYASQRELNSHDAGGYVPARDAGGDAYAPSHGAASWEAFKPVHGHAATHIAGAEDATQQATGYHAHGQDPAQDAGGYDHTQHPDGSEPTEGTGEYDPMPREAVYGSTGQPAGGYKHAEGYEHTLHDGSGSAHTADASGYGHSGDSNGYAHTDDPSAYTHSADGGSRYAHTVEVS